MALQFKKEDLKKLTSKINYDKFEHTQNACNNVNFHLEIVGAFGMYHNVNVISQKLQEAVCFMYKKKKASPIEIDEELCSYFYYWVGQNILEHLWNKSNFSKIIQIIYQELNRTDKGTICNPPYKNIDENTFSKYKLLFDYSNDHEHVNLNTVHGNTTCDEHYKEAIQQYINAYMDVYKHCNGIAEKIYDCEYFNKLFNKDEHEEFKSFNCGIYKEEIHTSQLQGEHTSRHSSLPNFPPSEKVSSFAEHVDTQRNKVYYLRHPPYENNVPALRHEAETNSSFPTERTSESGSSKTIASSVVPVLGVSSISLLLYKVTPVGGYINRLLGRNRNMYNTIEHMDEFNPYRDGMHPAARRMNISYHRL